VARTSRAFVNMEGFCIVDAQPIPKARLLKGSVVCSDRCLKVRQRALRTVQDQRECRYCRHPSTPEEREAYKRFRALEKKRPDLLYPEAFAAFRAECEAQVGGIEPTPEAFARHFAGRNEPPSQVENESEVHDEQ
jgi:hypothetical protein